jgi:hypothetical protein
MRKETEKKETKPERYLDLDLHINSSLFLKNLVYSKTGITSDLTLENEVNLNDISSMNESNSAFVHKLKDENDSTLIFESRFESGNLLYASKVKEDEYHLLLQCDTNTFGYTKWFYFRVSNTRKNMKVKLNIINQVRRL